MEAELGPKVDVAFSPTGAFAKTFGDEEAQAQQTKFNASTWGTHLQQPQQQQLQEEVEEVTQMTVNPTIVIGCIFLGGAIIGALLGWKFLKASPVEAAAP